MKSFTSLFQSSSSSSYRTSEWSSWRRVRAILALTVFSTLCRATRPQVDSTNLFLVPSCQKEVDSQQNDNIRHQYLPSIPSPRFLSSLPSSQVPGDCLQQVPIGEKKFSNIFLRFRRIVLKICPYFRGDPQIFSLWGHYPKLCSCYSATLPSSPGARPPDPAAHEVAVGGELAQEQDDRVLLVLEPWIRLGNDDEDNDEHELVQDLFTSVFLHMLFSGAQQWGEQYKNLP